MMPAPSEGKVCPGEEQLRGAVAPHSSIVTTATTHDHKEVTMKTQLRIASLAMLCLALAAIPAWAQSYNNGPCNCDTDALTINYGYIVSDTFTGLSKVGSFSFVAWEYPGDNMGVLGGSLGWSISTQENGNPVPGGSGTAQGAVNMTQQLISTNAYGYEMDLITVTGLGVTGLNPANTYWLNLQNAYDPNHPTDPIFWDENFGVGCTGDGSPGSCPSLASESGIGTMPSEAFTISESQGGTTPEPSSFALFGSGILGVAGVLRRRLMG